MYTEGKTKEEILEFINNWGHETFAKTLGIQFTDIDLENETLTATMPVSTKNSSAFRNYARRSKLRFGRNYGLQSF